MRVRAERKRDVHRSARTLIRLPPPSPGGRRVPIWKLRHLHHNPCCTFVRWRANRRLLWCPDDHPPPLLAVAGAAAGRLRGAAAFLSPIGTGFHARSGFHPRRRAHHRASRQRRSAQCGIGSGRVGGDAGAICRCAASDRGRVAPPCDPEQLEGHRRSRPAGRLRARLWRGACGAGNARKGLVFASRHRRHRIACCCSCPMVSTRSGAAWW